MSDEERKAESGDEKKSHDSSSDSSSSESSDDEHHEGELANLQQKSAPISPVSPRSRVHSACTSIPLPTYQSPLPTSYPNTPYPDGNRTRSIPTSANSYPSPTPYPPATYPLSPYPTQAYPTMPTDAYPKNLYPSTTYPENPYPKMSYPGISSLPTGYPPVDYPLEEKVKDEEPEPEKEEPEPEEHKSDHEGDDGDKHKTEDIEDEFSKMMKYGTAEVFKGTIYPDDDFNPESCCEVLRDAMSGLGTDEQPIIDIASSKSNKQRHEIDKVYKTMYGEDLIEELLSELTGNFEEAIIALFHPRTYYDAWSLNKAMSGPGTKDKVLIEILCTRTNAEITEIVECYEKHFERSLEEDIMDDTSGYFKRLLVSCLQANRDELSSDQMEQVLSDGPGCVIDEDKAKEEAQNLFEAGEGKIGTEEATFLQIMSLRHFYQLRATFKEYKEVSGKDIVEAVEGEFTGDEEEAFRAVVMSARNRPEYFAERLYNAMKGAGTDDSTLIRVIVARSEIDLQNIKDEFEKKYGKSLRLFVEEDTTGDYRRLMAAIMGS